MKTALKSALKKLALAWAVLALLSLAVRLATGPAPDPPLEPDTLSITVQRADGPARLAYRAWGPADAPVLLAIHGSPGSGSNFEQLAALLAERWRVLAPDLPGFGQSSLAVSDLSIDDHADDLLALLDALRVERAHLLGYSLGGGVALQLWQRAPGRVASLTLLSSIGVQELELLGDHALNHGLHLLQLGALQALDLCVPHFGATRAFQRALNYARNFSETDQRPLRELLSRYDGPALVVHGQDDFLVPPEAARESHRLLPQSALWMATDNPAFGGADHFMVFRGDPPFVPELRRFLIDVEAGRATTRLQASTERRALATEPFDAAAVPPASGPFRWLLLVLIALATLASEDLACVGAGLLAAQGRLGFVEASAAAFVGIFVGDMLLFAVGRLAGRPAVRRAPLRWMVSPAALERGAAWFERRGPAAILLSRFMPGLRLPTYLAAGLVGTGVLRFAFWFALAGLLWTPVLVALSLFAAPAVLSATGWLSDNPLLSLVVVVALLLIPTRLLPALATHRGRRLLVGRWQRLRHWEFWPPWMFYPPLVLWLAALSLRHRSLSVVTAVNPGIPAGGVIGESKAQILAQMPAAGEALPASIELPGALPLHERVARLARFMTERQLNYPVVLKPDAGQRGSGVAICRDAGQARTWLERSPVDMLAQEHVTGCEFGVFWYRKPGQLRGTIFSITEKRFPEVTGDGKRTLEELILNDSRAVALFAVYAGALGERLLSVPASGELVRLTELGTHCRGAIFLDGCHLASEALAARLDQLLLGFDGFAFGRFDLRVPSAEHLSAGRDLRIIELNGLTSEATHIYDRRHSLLYAWGVLFRQWSLAFDIGVAQRAAGHKSTSAWQVLALVRQYRRDAAARGAD